MKTDKGSLKRQFIAVRVLGFVIPFPIGLALGWLLLAPLVHEKDFVQGIFTASSVLIGLSGVLLGIVRFPRYANIAEKLLAGTFKAMLILSLVFGLLTIFLSLSWYAKAGFDFLRYAVMSFGCQLGYILVFLFFPKYYLR